MLDLHQLKMSRTQNYLLKFAVFMEIISAAIALMNFVGVAFGMNLQNYWFYLDSETPFDGILGIIFGIGLLYVVISWLVFQYQLRLRRR